jgi:hypothetical protein
MRTSFVPPSDRSVRVSTRLSTLASKTYAEQQTTNKSNSSSLTTSTTSTTTHSPVATPLSKTPRISLRARSNPLPSSHLQQNCTTANSHSAESDPPLQQTTQQRVSNIHHTTTTPFIPTVEDIAHHKPLLRFVPLVHQSAFTRLCATAFRAYCAATAKTTAQTIALTNLLSIPSVCLVQARTRGHKRYHRYVCTPAYNNNNNKSASHHSSLSARTKRCIDTAELALWDETVSLLHHMQDAFPSTQTRRQTQTNPTPHPKQQTDRMQQLQLHIDKRARRAVAILRSGYDRRAARSLTQSMNIVNPCSETDVEQMRILHPPPTSSLPLLPSSSLDFDTAVDSTTIQHVLPKTRNGAAGGLSGWTTDHLCVLLNDTTCMNGLAKLVADILNDNFTEEGRRFIVAAKLIGIPKDGNEQKLRPIAITEVFTRLAATVAFYKHDSTILEKLNKGGVQYGLQSLGCQRVHSAVLSMLQCGSIQRAALCIDFANAFNTINRAHVMNTVYTDPQLRGLHKCVSFLYGRPSPLYSLDTTTGKYKHIIDSTNGVRQGCPLSSALFALSVQLVYDQVIKTLKTVERSPAYSCYEDSVKAIHDDLTVMLEMKKDSIERVVNVVIDAAERIGMNVSKQKCKLIWLHGLNTVDGEVIHYCKTNEIELTECTILLGAPVAHTAEQTQSLTIDIVNSHSSYFQSINSSAMPCQDALALLRLAAAPKLDYVSQLIAPSLSLPALELFDANVRHAALNKLQLSHTLNTGVCDTDSVLLQLSLSLRRGGFGLGSTVSTAPSAYISTHLQIAAIDEALWSHLHIRLHDNALPTTSTDLRPIAAHLADSIKTIQLTNGQHPTRSSAIKSLPRVTADNSADVIAWCHKNGTTDRIRLRRQLTTAIEDAAEERMWQKASQSATDKHLVEARQLCVQAAHASDWLQCVASTQIHRIPDAAFQLQARLRLGLPNDDESAEAMVNGSCERVCVCGAITADCTHHFLACNKATSARTRRHELIKLALKQQCNVALLQCAVEPQYASVLPNKPSLRPDLLVDLSASRQVMIDVTVSHPLRSTFLHRAAQSTLASCEHAAQLKKEKYSALAQRHQCQFSAFACETFGGLSRSAVDLIKSLVYSSPENGVELTKGQLTFSIFNAIAASIVNGNWSIYRHMKNQTIIRAASGFSALWRVGMQRRHQHAAGLLQLARAATIDNFQTQSCEATTENERESIQLNETVAV